MRRKLKWLTGVWVMLFLAPAAAGAADNSTCGINPGVPLSNSYGPWDYTDPMHAPKLPIVLRRHFTGDVERLVRGSTGSLYHDLDYTLRAIPNYHRALYAMAKLQRRDNFKGQPGGSYFSSECYFKRAIYLQPNDAVSRMLYGMHLHLIGKKQLSLEQYLQAIRLNPENPEYHYNIGLLYLDLGNIEKAEEHAKIAYDKGYPLNGLRRKLGGE